jgi:hypothetical protein
MGFSWSFFLVSSDMASHRPPLSEIFTRQGRIYKGVPMIAVFVEFVCILQGLPRDAADDAL